MIEPNYFGTWCFTTPGQDLLLTIRKIEPRKLKNDDGVVESVPVMFFEGPHKPMILNVDKCTTMETIFGTPDTNGWLGRSIQVYPDTTEYKDKVVDCVRIRNFVPDLVKSSEEWGQALETFNTNGREFYGYEWDAKRAELVKAALKHTDDVDELTTPQITELNNLMVDNYTKSVAK
jgi:hypothetical protein